MTRVYAAADEAALKVLAAGAEVRLTAHVAASEDEEDEYEALRTAADEGAVVVTAVVESESSPIRLELVESFHVDADDSGDLAWYARQEIDAVLDIVAQRR